VNFLLEKQNLPRDSTKTRVIREEVRAKRSGNGWAYFGDIRRIISLSNAHLLRSICTWSPRNPCIVASRILHHRKRERERERERTDERTARGTVVEPGSQRAISRGVPAYERGVMAQPAWLGSCRRERDRISSSGTNVVKRENGEQRRDGRSCEQASRSVARESGGKLSLERLHEGNPASLPRSLPLRSARKGASGGLILQMHAVLRGGTPGSGGHPLPLPQFRTRSEREGRKGGSLWKLAGDTVATRCGAADNGDP